VFFISTWWRTAEESVFTTSESMDEAKENWQNIASKHTIYFFIILSVNFHTWSKLQININNIALFIPKSS